MTVAVVMPAFDEADRIGAILTGIPSSMLGHDVTVVVVDDGSRDGTGDIARAAGAVVLRSERNRGKGHALRRGMQQAGELDPSAFVWMDSDGQHVGESLPALVAPVLTGDADMVVGSRYLTRSDVTAPRNRRLVRRATVAAIRASSGLLLTDPFSGFRCFSPAAASVLSFDGDRYEAELESLLAVARAGLDVVEVPIPRVYGPNTSKMGHRHGPLLGRLLVVWGYARTLAAGSGGRSPAVVRIDARV